MDESPAVSEHVAEQARGRDLLIGVAIICATQVLLGVLLALSMGIHSVFELHPFAFLLVTLTGGAITVLVAWFLVCQKYLKSFADGFMITRPSKKTLVLSIVIAMGLAIGGMVLASMFATAKHPFARLALSTPGLIAFVLLALLMPIVEELYYRGFIFPILERKFGGLAATFVVIIWFTAAHVRQSLNNLIVIPIILALGTVLTVQRRITGSLTMPLVTHWTYNLCVVIAPLALSGEA